MRYSRKLLLLVVVVRLPCPCGRETSQQARCGHTSSGLKNVILQLVFVFRLSFAALNWDAMSCVIELN